MSDADVSGLVKILFELDPDDWHGRTGETMWAEPVPGASAATVLQLRNTPFFAQDVSFLDIVRAVPCRDRPEFAFAGVIDRSGHSTYTVLVPEGSQAFEVWWQRLESIGCSYEGAGALHVRLMHAPMNLYAVDVPPETDVHSAYAILDEGEQQGLWTFQEGHCGHMPAGPSARPT